MKKSFTNPAVKGAESLLTQGFASCAFTMAEILLSLTIIGVVAAITLPSLMGNINERTWNTQRKALHARMSQAIAMMPQLNGYGKYETDSDGNVTDTAAEAFLTEGLSKVLKINNICDSEHLEDCGLSSTVYKMNGSVAFSSVPKAISEFSRYWVGSPTTLSLGTVKTAGFESQNGESFLLAYNPVCSAADVTRSSVMGDYNICANFLYDLNGAKGPNTFGKDVGIITAFYPVDSAVVAPMPIAQQFRSETFGGMGEMCLASDPNSRIANIEETFALAINTNFLGFGYDCNTWASNTKIEADSYKEVVCAEPQYNVNTWEIDEFRASDFFCVKR